MIFLTLGTQLPFDRLVQTLDMVAADLDEPIFGQVGKTDYRPTHFEIVDFLTPSQFAEKMAEARVVVGHAGIGTILTGMRLGKPLVLMARKAKLGEHRNDHQSATIAQVRSIAGISVVESAEEMHAALAKKVLEPMSDSGSKSRLSMINALREEVGLF